MDDDIASIARKDSDYQSARFVSKLISFLGWLVVLLGIGVSFIGEILFVLGFDSSETVARIPPAYLKFIGVFLSIIPGVVMSLMGLVFVAIGQVTRAIVDNTDYTRAMLRSVNKSFEHQLKDGRQDLSSV